MKHSDHPNSPGEYLCNATDETVILLESQLTGYSTQQSFLGYNPKRIIKANGNEITLFEHGKISRFKQDPFEALSQFYSRKKSWLLGYFGYDLKNSLENLSSENIEYYQAPDLFFMEPENLIRFIDNKPEWLNGKPDKSENQGSPADIKIQQLEPAISRSEFKRNVEYIQQAISEGDYYELNYSFPLCGQYQGDPFSLYQEMKKINPVPFGAFIRTEEFTICCNSPERFLKKNGIKLISEPIKGTAARGINTASDLELKEILNNEKNRAENLMIVDLVRHDLSKIARIGSVKAEKLFNIQTFGTVHQLISMIEAEVLKHDDPVNMIRACFPMGSMTGAPKIEVMKAIEELEIYKRGIYSGAIGYFSPKGDFDFNVVIRSAILQDGNLCYPVGGAITADSDPQDEWNETLVKSKVITSIADNVKQKKYFTQS